MALNLQNISSSPDTVPMMENVDKFKKKLEVLPPDVLEKWLRDNQRHPFAFIGLGIKAEQDKMRAGMQPKPTATVYEEELGQTGVASLDPRIDRERIGANADSMLAGVNTPSGMPPQMGPPSGMPPGMPPQMGPPNAMLPRTQMANNGGIVGFAGGDYVPDVMDQGLLGLETPPDMYMNNGGIVGFQNRGLVPGAGYSGMTMDEISQLSLDEQYGLMRRQHEYEEG